MLGALDGCGLEDGIEKCQMSAEWVDDGTGYADTLLLHYTWLEVRLYT